jgi:hypothetical protein
MAMTSTWPRVVFISGGVEKEENLGDVIFTKDVRLLSPRARRHCRGTKKDKKKIFLISSKTENSVIHLRNLRSSARWA